MEDYYNELTETPNVETAVGDVYYDQGTNYFVVPFIHCDTQFLTYFTSIKNTPNGVTLEDLRKVMESTVKHAVCDEPYFLKFGLTENFRSEDVYGATNSQVIKQVMFTLPAKLAICVDRLLQKTSAQEFYFIPGSKDEQHQEKLDKWYGRVSDRVAASLGLAPIHNDTKGGWYGYKKND